MPNHKPAAGTHLAGATVLENSNSDISPLCARVCAGRTHRVHFWLRSLAATGGETPKSFLPRLSACVGPTQRRDFDKACTNHTAAPPRSVAWMAWVFPKNADFRKALTLLNSTCP